MNEPIERWPDVATEVRARMDELGIHSQVELCLAADVSDPTARVFMTGRLRDGKPPQDAPRKKIARALRWTPDSIDRILEGLAPIDASPIGGVSPLDERLDRQQGQLEALTEQTSEILRLVAGQGAAIDQILAELRREGRGS